MNNFVVIDHSIKRIGGHNYEYALHILSAAEREGYRPILAVNRRFFERRRLPASWQLFTPFHHTTYETASLTAKQRWLDPQGAFTNDAATKPLHAAGSSCRSMWVTWLPAWLRRGLVQRYERQKRRIIERYTADLARLFGEMPLEPGDHVFVPTLSEDDLIGLLSFFRAKPAAAGAVRWHLQFHFSLYEGREPQYDGQEHRLAGLKRLFRDAAGALPSGCMRFYTTTDILAAQYNRLGAAQFEALPYPVNPALLEKPRRGGPAEAPLRVTCAGGVRPEKGTADLYRAVAPLWRDYFEAGRLQLVVQAKRAGKLPRELRMHAEYDGKHAGRQGQLQPRPTVAVVRWPLSTKKYLDLIRESHIGLLLYDADQYYARCSGVMVEMLKAGVPVIVPAGCWMANEIAEPILAHRDRVCSTMTVMACLSPADADWEAGRAQRYYLWRRNARLLVGGEGGRLGTRLPVPQGASHLCVRFRWSASSARGGYLELSAVQKLDGNRALPILREIVGVRSSGAPLPILMPLAPAARHVELVWRNAFGHDVIELEDVEFVFLSADRAACPLGAVGLIAAGVDQAPLLLRDIADHYAHYRRSAEQFAPAWGEWHSPEKVVRLLTDDRVAERRSAA